MLNALTGLRGEGVQALRNVPRRNVAGRSWTLETNSRKKKSQSELPREERRKPLRKQNVTTQLQKSRLPRSQKQMPRKLGQALRRSQSHRRIMTAMSNLCSKPLRRNLESHGSLLPKENLQRKKQRVKQRVNQRRLKKIRSRSLVVRKPTLVQINLRNERGRFREPKGLGPERLGIKQAPRSH